MIKIIAFRLGFIMMIAMVLSVSACSSDTDNKKGTEIEDWEDGFVEDNHTMPEDTNTDDKISTQLDPVTLTVHYFSQDDVVLEALKKAAEGYTTSHPEVSVIWKWHPRTQPVKLTQLMEQGEAQDLYWIDNRDDLRDFVEDGLAVDVSSYQGEFGGDAYYASLVGSLSIDGRIYGFPIANDTELIYYNKKLVTGDSVPSLNWTYEDMIRSIKNVMKVQSVKTGIAQGNTLLLAAGQSYGGGPLNEDSSKLVLNSSFRQGLSLLLNALAIDKIGDRLEIGESSGMNDFYHGEVPMMVGSSWQLESLLQGLSDVDIAPFPAGPMKQQGMGHVESLTVSAKSERPEMAIEFAQYMSGSEEANIVYATGHVTLPLMLTDKVREAWRNSFEDPAMADRLEYIVKSNAGNIYALNGEPGYRTAYIMLSILLNDMAYGQGNKTHMLDASFDQALDRINADWALTQEEARKP